MKYHIVCHLILQTMILSLNISTSNAQKASGQDFGKFEYESNCATCHGITGRGDGPTAPWLTRKAADLTTIKKRNGGIMPASMMYDIIAGEQEIGSHGSREMPVWGREYRMKAAEHYFEAAYDSEAYVRIRILSIIEYIDRLQK